MSTHPYLEIRTGEVDECLRLVRETMGKVIDMSDDDEPNRDELACAALRALRYVEDQLHNAEIPGSNGKRQGGAP